MKRLFKTSGLFIMLMMMIFGGMNFSAKAASKEYQNTVAEYLKATNAKETIILTLVQTYKGMSLPVSDVQGMTEDIINTIWSDYIVDSANIMEQYYSLDDLKEVIKFYQTPVGKKFAKYSPEVAEKTSKIMMGQNYVNTIQKVMMKYIR